MIGDMTTPRRVQDVSAGDWVDDRLLKGWTTEVPAGAVVPTGFERVVRVLHPAGDGRTWAQVAAAHDRVMHPLAQWCGINPAFDGTGRSSWVDPDEGSMPPAVQRAVLDHCPATGDLFYAVWVGWGSWEEPEQGATMHGRGGYRLFTAPKTVITSWPGMASRWGQSASLIWPPDRSWCIATDIDWDSTLVAGDSTLADALLGEERLEAVEVADEDDLSWLGDRINPRPAWLGSANQS